MRFPNSHLYLLENAMISQLGALQSKPFRLVADALIYPEKASIFETYCRLTYRFRSVVRGTRIGREVAYCSSEFAALTAAPLICFHATIPESNAMDVVALLQGSWNLS
jgi:hypothetical protein